MATIKNFYAWIGPSNGYAAINWRASTAAGSYDWVGLYTDDAKGQNDYAAYQWVSSTSTYDTSSIIADGMSVRYFTWSGDHSVLSGGRVVLFDAQGISRVTPAALTACLSGYYVEQMRTRPLNIKNEVNATGEAMLQTGCWVTCSPKGYAELHWTVAKSQGNSDWIALYQDVNRSNGDYMSWKWARNGSSHITSTAFGPGIHARYIKEGPSPYVALRRSKPIATGYFDLESMYVAVASEGKELMAADVAAASRILKIMADQLGKAVQGEPSVFSPGIWPFGDNLLFKNLSYEEVKVIGQYLAPSRYYDVIMVYYETYRMAITIADDGERNAKRHAFWQISMMQKFGESFAKAIGDAHERGRPGTAEDNRVDDLNNAAALVYAKGHPDVDPATAANQMWSSGLLADYNDDVAPVHTKDEL